MKYWHGRKSPISAGAPSALAWVWIFKRLAAGDALEDAAGHSVTLRHEGRCGRCARALTTPESLDTGYGPDCAEKLGILWEAQVELEGNGIPLVNLEWLLSGAAIVTATSSRGGRFTYRIDSAKARSEDDPRRWWVKVLTGPDNVSDYTYLGSVVA